MKAKNRYSKLDISQKPHWSVYKVINVKLVHHKTYKAIAENNEMQNSALRNEMLLYLGVVLSLNE